MIKYVISLVLYPVLAVISFVLQRRNALVQRLFFSPFHPRLRKMKGQFASNGDLVLHYSFECLVNFVEVSLTHVYFYYGLYHDEAYAKYGKFGRIDALKFIFFGQVRSAKIGLSVLEYYLDTIKNSPDFDPEKGTYLERVKELYLWWTTERMPLIDPTLAETTPLEQYLETLQKNYLKDDEMLIKLIEIRPYLFP